MSTDPLSFRVDGRTVEIPDAGESLLDVLRDRLGKRSVKDGCSPQGQCGCCTVWVDGAARVACVTPARRVAGRSVTTLDGLDPRVRHRWAEAFTQAGASQCGFCTPGIIMRLAALEAGSRSGSGAAGVAGGTGAGSLSGDEVESALLAHLCRCTGWRTILQAAESAPAGLAGRPRDLAAASRRATIEGGSPQSVGPSVALGEGGFADDTAPPGSLVAVPDGEGEWAVGETLADARRSAGKVQGRRSTAALAHPIELPPGRFDLTLRTTWVEPAYLELDASWCAPGGEAVTPLANGGAFGAKVGSEVAAAARRLADQNGRPVRVLWSREDAVRRGPKRPPMAAGVRGDGSGVLRFARTAGVAAAAASVAPSLVVEEVDVAGPPTSCALRGAGWVEAAVLLAALRARAGRDGAAGEVWPAVRVVSPAEATAEARVDDDGRVMVTVRCGEVLDETVLRSYCVGAAHMALGWVRSEGIAVDEGGEPRDLTIRSFGVLRARDTPDVVVDVADDDGPPVNGSDAVFASVAAAVWLADGLAPEWPTRRGA